MFCSGNGAQVVAVVHMTYNSATTAAVLRDGMLGLIQCFGAGVLRDTGGYAQYFQGKHHKSHSGCILSTTAVAPGE